MFFFKKMNFNELNLCQSAAFIVRMYSTEPITVERVSPLETHLVDGSWNRSGDLDSTGGALRSRVEDSTKTIENIKWCQNPQFHLEVADPYGHDEIFLKIVLRRTDRGAHQGHGAKGGGGGGENKAVDVTVGMVVCKADCLEDNSAMRKKNQPRTNALGEVISFSLFHCLLLHHNYYFSVDCDKRIDIEEKKPWR